MHGHVWATLVVVVYQMERNFVIVATAGAAAGVLAAVLAMRWRRRPGHLVSSGTTEAAGAGGGVSAAQVDPDLVDDGDGEGTSREPGAHDRCCLLTPWRWRDDVVLRNR